MTIVPSPTGGGFLDLGRVQQPFQVTSLSPSSGTGGLDDRSGPLPCWFCGAGAGLMACSGLLRVAPDNRFVFCKKSRVKKPWSNPEHCDYFNTKIHLPRSSRDLVSFRLVQSPFSLTAFPKLVAVMVLSPVVAVM